MCDAPMTEYDKWKTITAPFNEKLKCERCGYYLDDCVCEDEEDYFHELDEVK